MNHDIASIVRNGSLALGLSLIGGACGSTAPTQQLVDARRAYSDAVASEAAQLTPDKLLTAQQALERAEKEHNDDPGSAQEAHLAYMAERKAGIAMAHGKIAAAKQMEGEADARYQTKLRAQASANQSQLQDTQEALTSERTRRAEAEKRAAAALQSLAEVAKVNEEQRGTVITLPGGVLFPSGGRDLSAAARQSLNRVAEALSEQPSESKIVIEGHTDARGSDDRNQMLSQQRAESVRNYLVERGVEQQRVVAVGKGEASPIADNESSEGRATNRRVEIVVSSAGAPSTGGMTEVQPSAPGTPAAAAPTAPASAHGGTISTH